MVNVVQEASEQGGRAIIADSEEELLRFETESVQGLAEQHSQMQEAILNMVVHSHYSAE